MNIHHYLFTLSITLLLSACGGGGGNDTNNNTNTTPPDTSNRAKLQTTDSSLELETYLKSLWLELYGTMRPMPVSIIAASSSSGSVADFSATNVQENTVDEADRIKTDGTYLYVASLETPDLRIFKTQQGSSNLVKTLNLNNENSTTQTRTELYLYAQKLIAIKGGLQNYWEQWFIPNYWDNQQSQIHLFDISNPENTTQTTQLLIEGKIISSRRIDSTLYIATRHHPILAGLTTYPDTETEVAENRRIINAASLNDFLPDYSLNTNKQEIFSSNDCFIAPYTDKKNTQASIISLIAIDLSNNTPIPQGKCFAGDSETLYASSEAIYLATTQYDYSANNEENIIDVVYPAKINTDLHKFSLTNSNIEYRGSGRVAGHLGWKQDLKPFRMSEHNNRLRIITYTGETPASQSSPAQLFVLEENTSNQSLDTIAQLPNETRTAPLGKPGEQIYASRFLGDKAYLVTFRVTDPLYMIDLSNPRDPFIAGELQIEGYSDYLHPIGERFLLGIGKDAVAASDLADGRGAWYQGVKLSLIDISNPTNMFEKEKQIIGKRGTETAVSYTHHAFTSLARGNTLHIALPISLHESAKISENNTAADHPSDFYRWDQDELYRLNIDTRTGQIEIKPAIVGQTRQDDRTSSGQWQDDRSVIIGDYVYYLHGDQITGQIW